MAGEHRVVVTRPRRAVIRSDTSPPRQTPLVIPSVLAVPVVVGVDRSQEARLLPLRAAPADPRAGLVGVPEVDPAPHARFDDLVFRLREGRVPALDALGSDHV